MWQVKATVLPTSQPLAYINCFRHTTQNDSTVSDWRLISSRRHPRWRGWFFQTQRRSGARCLCRALDCVGSCILFLQLHSRTEPHSMDATSIFHGGGALISTELRISATRSLHYSPPSLVAGLICVDKGLDGRMWFRLYRSHSTIFIPIVDSAALEWHHSSIFTLNHLYSGGIGGWPPLKICSLISSTSMLIITGPHLEGHILHLERNVHLVTSFHWSF